MAKPDDTKLRLLAVYNMIQRGGWITTRQIQRELDLRYDIQANRKTIYNDIYAINKIIPVETKSGARGGFCKIDVLGRCD